MTPRVRRWARRGLVLGGLAAAAVAGLAVVSQTAAFRDWLRREVVARVNAELNGRLVIGALDGNLFGTLVARDVRLVQDGERVLAVRRLVATYDLPLLARGGGVRVTSLVADGVALRLAADERGWNVERLAKAAGEEPRPTLVVDLRSLRVTNGAVRIVHSGRGWRLRGVTVEGAARFAPGAARVAIDALAFREQGSGVRFEEVVGRVAAEHGEWRIEDARARTAASSVALTGRFGAAVDGVLRVERLAAADARALLRAGLPRSDWLPPSDWRGELRAHGPRAAVAVTGALAAEAAGDAGPRAVGRLGIEGTLDLAAAAPTGSLRAALEHVDLAAIAGARFPPTDLAGSVTLAVRAEARRVYDVGLDLGASRVGTTALASTRGTLRVADDGLRFDVAATNDAGSVRASGDVALGAGAERYAVDVVATELDLGALLARPALAGRLNATARVAGVGFEPATTRFDASVAIAPSRVGGVTIARGDAAVRADAGRLTVDRLDVATNVGTVAAAGDARLGGAPGGATGGVRAEARVTDLAPLAALLGRFGFSGAGSVRATLRGSPAAFDAEVVVAARQLAGAGWRTATLDASLVGRGLGGAAADVALHGTAREAALGERRLTEIGVDAGARGALTALRGDVAVRAREPDGAFHELRADVARRGDTTRATVGTVRFTHRGTVWTALGTPVLELRGARLSIGDLALRAGDGSVRVTGVLAAGGSDLEVVVDGLDLEALAGLVPAEARGRLAGRVRLGGGFAAPRIDADVDIAAPTLGGTRYDELRARVAVAAGRGELHGRLARAAQTLVVDAGAPLVLALAPFRFALGDPEARVRADGIDLAFVGALWPDLVSKVGGTLDGDVRVAGPVAAPEAHGTIGLTGGRAHVVPLGVTYDAIDAAVRLDGRVASIDRLTIASGKGRVAGGGTARLGAGGATMDARFEAKRFPLFTNEYGRGAASGWLWLSGTTAAPVVEGSLETDGLVLQIPEALAGSARPLDPTIVIVGPGAPPPPPAVPSAPPPPSVPTIFERAAVTVQLAVPRDAWVRRSDANVELQGWITAWKKPGEELHLAGDVRGVRGWYAFQGKKFTLEEGSVRFSGQGFDPALDITATHRTGEYLVRLEVGGTVTRPTLALASEPELDQADVLAVLLFGAPADRLSRSQSVGLREQALGIAGGYVASELRESVANALGVDDLQFDAGTSGLQDARVSVGKYVADDIFVSLAHRFGQSVEELRIEYVIRPGWSLETSTDTVGRSGVDLLWKRRY
ncbi:MAG: translocation/assembly module TamB domain-containing protein [Deltaproteobacteria bacterium]|nr:translocation/assembly module TamB domain-containing protein [Deltaproteobacteria bacterium]